MRLRYDSKHTLKATLVIQPGTVLGDIPHDIAAQLQGQSTAWRVDEPEAQGEAQGGEEHYSPEGGVRHATRTMRPPERGTAADGTDLDPSGGEGEGKTAGKRQRRSSTRD